MGLEMTRLKMKEKIPSKCVNRFEKSKRIVVLDMS